MAGDVLAQVRRTLTYDDLMSVRTPVDIDASADGSALTIVAQLRRDLQVPRLLRHGDPMPAYELNGTLSVFDAATGSVLATWDWPDKVWNARVSPRGDRVVATITVDGHTGLWSAALDGTAAVCLVEQIARPYLRAVLGWTAEGQAVVTLDVPASLAPPPEAANRPPEGVAVDHLVNDPAAGCNAGASHVRPERTLIELDVATGAARTIVERLALSDGVVSPDGRWIACVGEPARVEMSSFSTRRPVDIRSLADGTVVAGQSAVVTLSYNFPRPVWHPASNQVAQVADGAVFFMALDGSSVEVRAGIPFRGDRGGAEPTVEPAWSGDGSHLVVGDTGGGLWGIGREAAVARSIQLPEHEASVQLLTGPEGILLEGDHGRFPVVVRSPSTAQSELWSLSLVGAAPVQVEAEPASLMGFDFVGVTSVGAGGGGTERRFYLADSAQRPPEVYEIDGRGALRRITELNPVLDDVAPPYTVRLWFDHGGERMTAFAWLPEGWSPDLGPIPFVVDGYPAGDLWGRTADRWEGFRVIPPQLLTAQGWGVLVVGATPGRDAATRAELVAPVLAAVESAVAAGMADERVALVGQSGGGYTVNSAVTVTSRFRAAIAFSGLANLASHFGQVYVGTDGPLMHGTANAEVLGGGPPWSAVERYIEKSPLFHLDKVDTPLLLVHGTGDMAVMVQGADEMFVGLRRLGKYVEILRYHGEGHAPPHWTEPNRTHMFGRVIDFLDRHLR